MVLSHNIQALWKRASEQHERKMETRKKYNCNKKMNGMRTMMYV